MVDKRQSTGTSSGGPYQRPPPPHGKHKKTTKSTGQQGDYFTLNGKQVRNIF
jgi:hypothetical protein